MANIPELWRVSPSEKDDGPVFSAAFQPPFGNRLAVAKGRRVLIFNSEEDGALLSKLKGHKGHVCALSYSADGKMLASNGTDNITIIWDGDTGKGMLKLDHETCAQAVAFNPSTGVLASCSEDEFVLWTPSTRRLTRNKVTSKILDCSWSQDGAHLALAHESGALSLYGSEENKVVASLYKCESPVTCVEFISSRQLVFGSKERLTFFDIRARRTLKTRDMDFLPCTLSYSGGHLVIAGNGGFSLQSPDGLELATIIDSSLWIWSVSCIPKGNMFAVGTESGAVIMHRIDYTDNPILEVELLIRLNRWDEARRLAEDSGCVEVGSIIKRCVNLALENDDVELAKIIYLESGDYLQALKVLGSKRSNSWEHEILEIVKKANLQKEVVAFASSLFVKAGAHSHLAELHRLCEDYNSLLQLHMDCRNWNEAEQILEEHKELLDNGGFSARAKMFVMRGQFRQAFDAYTQAGRYDMARKIMIELSNSAALMNDYKKASQDLWILIKALRDGEVSLTTEVWSDLIKRTECYYLYHRIFLSFTQPFTSIHPEALLNAAALLVNGFSQNTYGCIGVSMPDVVSTLANVAASIGAHSTAKRCVDLLQEQEMTNEDASNASVDAQDLLPVCYVCGSENALLRDSVGDSCINCRHPFLRCFLNFDVLPLVEFGPADGISYEEATDLIVNEESPNDPKVMFDECIQQSLEDQNQTDCQAAPTAIAVGRGVLAALDREDIFIITPKGEAQKCRFFRNLLPEIGIALCQECCHFFHEEDFEFTVLRDGGCPFCSCSLIGQNYGHA